MSWNEDLVFSSQQGEKSYLFSKVSRPTVKPYQAIHWISWATPLGKGMGVERRPGHEADFSILSTTEVTNLWSYITSPPICFHGGA
jgi:hypothetical protein